MKFHLSFLLLCLLAVPSAWAQDVAWQQAVAQKDFGRAERLIRRELEQNKDNTDLRFALARVLAWQGAYGQAVDEYRALLAKYPEHADYLLGLAQALFWQGKTQQALETTIKAKSLAPDYEDVWELHIRILAALDTPEATKQAQAVLAAAEHRFGQQSFADLRNRMMAQENLSNEFVPLREMEVGATYEHLTEGFDAWQSLYVEGEYRYLPRRVIYGRSRLTERFKTNDTELLLGTVQPVSESIDMQVEVSGSPTYEVLPKYSALAGFHYQFKPLWDASIVAKHSTYGQTYNNLVSLGLGRYLDAYRLDYVLYIGRAEGATEAYAHRWQATRYYGEANRVGLYFAVGQETENSGISGPNELLTDSVKTIGLAGRHWIQVERWALSYNIWRHAQGDRYTRWGGSIGLRRRF